MACFWRSAHDSKAIRSFFARLAAECNGELTESAASSELILRPGPAGSSAIVTDFMNHPVPITQWPHSGWRPVDPGTGDEGGYSTQNGAPFSYRFGRV